MTTKDKGTVMTQAQEIAELRRWMREDIGNLHKRLDKRDYDMNDKIDQYQRDNSKAHSYLQKQLTVIDKKTDSNTTRLALFNTGIAIAAAGIVSTAFNVFAG